jgi:hypothetical protein
MMMTMVNLLAQSEPIPADRVIVVGLILIGLIVVGAVATMYVRRWLKQDEEAPPMGFTLGDLREMHRKGQITNEEFERARGQMVAATRKAMDRPAGQPGPAETPNKRQPPRGRF